MEIRWEKWIIDIEIINKFVLLAVCNFYLHFHVIVMYQTLIIINNIDNETDIIKKKRRVAILSKI